ncbi:hypothetical protein HJD18_14310 [Thermoleophilia bacterium SCSIO 60948]|nr:hypothetical protein HJD18_14310 [Thermoleophilia bacterium SCSIO 60948]
MRRRWPIPLILLLAALSLVLCAGAAQAKVYSSGNVDRKLPDLGRVASVIKVPAGKRIASAKVQVRMSHGYTGDVLMGLEMPDGDFEELVSQGAAGGGDADSENFGAGPKTCGGQSTTFDDDSPFSIESGVAPFTGTYNPSESLNLAGERARGAYRLIVFDTNQGDSGRLHCWKLNLNFVD